MAEIANFLPLPSQLWVTDDTPGLARLHPARRRCLRRQPGRGLPRRLRQRDRRYEVLGRFDPTRRPAQLNIELHRGTKVTPPNMVNNTDLTPLASITDLDLQIAADGSFRITIGLERSPVHLLSTPGLLSLGSRDMLTSWDQRPSWMELRPLDDTEPAPFDLTKIVEAV
ncbi:hypothetical protein Franean1_0413 [Parafrankia sp. EAN1pec]|uniref:hypothetical protein n=1 Tax=Parafrankia sp. (strain EAN1pec) TaxID=298653 RepID=UPI00015D9FB7|nr:hypothetical protein Franean1_0413 [Frankia sp. EAN1pec]